MCPSNRDGGLLAGIWATATMYIDDPHALSQAFHVLDRDGDGAIRSDDLSTFFRGCLGQRISREEATSMIALGNPDGDGAVRLEDFQRLMRSEGAVSLIRKQQQEAQQAALREVFDVLDVNKDGKLGREDLRAAMAMSGQPFSEQELDAMVAAAARLQVDSDGGYPTAIDFDSFSKLMFAF